MEMTFRMKIGRLREADVEKKKSASAMGIRKDDQTVPITRKVSEGRTASIQFELAAKADMMVQPSKMEKRISCETKLKAVTLWRGSV